MRSAAEFLGTTEKTVRARADRCLLPARRFGGRVVFVRAELVRFLEELPGVTTADAVENIKRRTEVD